MQRSLSISISHPIMRTVTYGSCNLSLHIFLWTKHRWPTFPARTRVFFAAALLNKAAFTVGNFRLDDWLSGGRREVDQNRSYKDSDNQVETTLQNCCFRQRIDLNASLVFKARSKLNNNFYETRKRTLFRSIRNHWNRLMEDLAFKSGLCCIIELHT